MNDWEDAGPGDFWMLVVAFILMIAIPLLVRAGVLTPLGYP